MLYILHIAYYYIIMYNIISIYKLYEMSKQNWKWWNSIKKNKYFLCKVEDNKKWYIYETDNLIFLLLVLYTNID